jgi:hypothetical protein
MLFSHARVSCGMVPFWLDDYQYPRDAKELKQTTYCNPLRDPYPWVGYRPGTIPHLWMPWNHSHFMCGEVFDAWRLFGDPLALESVKNIGVMCQSYADFRAGPKWDENIARPYPSGGAPWEGGGSLPAGGRADGMPLHNLCQAYSITGDESMLKSLRRFAAVSWRQVEKTRGFYSPADVSGERGTPKGTISDDPAMAAQVMDGLLSYYSLTHDETAADQITGMLDWIMAEGTVGKYGHMTHFALHNAELYAQQRERYMEGVRKGTHCGMQLDPYLFLFAYNYTGEARYRDQWSSLMDGLKELKVQEGSIIWGFVHLHYRTNLAQMTEVINAPRTGQAPEAVKDLAAESLGGGKVKLGWTVPGGAPARYQAKWADKQIVERLQFDIQKHTFAFDPVDHANWWAANNVEGEPQPGAAGAKETMTVEGVTPGKRFFAVRSFDAASNRSALSNVVEVEVR